METLNLEAPSLALDDELGCLLGIDAELLSPTAHSHARALELKIRVNPQGDTGCHAHVGGVDLKTRQLAG